MLTFLSRAGRFTRSHFPWAVVTAYGGALFDSLLRLDLFGCIRRTRAIVLAVDAFPSAVLAKEWGCTPTVAQPCHGGARRPANGDRLLRLFPPFAIPTNAKSVVNIGKFTTRHKVAESWSQPID